MAKVNRNTPQQEPPQERKRLYLGLSLIAILICAIYSYKLRWLGDDIFIAFRYVQNLLEGNGLVYNIGERVEGYTDFLWIMIISLFSLLKFDPEFTVQALGIASSIGTLIIWSVIVHKTASRYKVFILPFISLALALNYDFNVWATSGLETSFFSFLLSCSFYSFFFSNFQLQKKYIFTGLFLCLAMMTRPDTLLIALLANVLFFVYQLIIREKISKIVTSVFLFNLAIICIYIPYFIWRYNYYGFIFPNTYYDKLGNETLFSKGFFYIWLYFKPHFISLLIVVLPPFILLKLFKEKSLVALKEFLSDKLNASFFACIVITYIYLVGFVAKVGGDFMHARFIIPIAPFFYFIIFYSLLKFVKTKNLNLLFTVLLAASLIETKIRLEMFMGPDKNGKIIGIFQRDVADERYVYTSYFKIEDEKKLGKALNKTFSGINAKMLVRGGQACMGYYANFGYAQEFHGLTDTLIAHSKIETRGRIGHEKHGTTEYFENKGVNFLFNRSPLSKDEYKYAEIYAAPYKVRAEIITYNNTIMSQLKAKLGDGLIYTDFQAYLDHYIKNKLPLISTAELKKDYDHFYLYYFKHNDDKSRENQFLYALNKK